MNCSAYRVIVIALTSPVELRHTVNAAVRSVVSAGLLPDDSVIIFDESKDYQGTYEVDEYSFPVVHTRSTLQTKLQKFVSVIPEGELVSVNWVQKSLDICTTHSDTVIVRPELCIRWKPTSKPIVQRQWPNLNPLYSITEHIYSGVVALDTSSFMQAIKRYSSPSKALIASQLWQQSESTIALKTAAFSQALALPVSPEVNLQSLKKARVSQPTEASVVNSSSIVFTKLIKAGKKLTIKGLRYTHLLETARRFTPDRQLVHTALPGWLVEEWKQIHRIENRLFLSRCLLESTTVQHEPPYVIQLLAWTYYELIQSLRQNTYDYVLFAPWLIRGGADKFTIEYANTIASIRPDISVLVVTTIQKNSEWAGRLSDNVDYCDFGNFTEGLSDDHKYRLLEVLLEQCKARVLHIINSEMAYNFVAHHKSWVDELGIKIVATSFSQEVSDSGRILGYSHSHVPKIYDQTSYITSDNNTVLAMWQRDYGFDLARLHAHHLPFPVKKMPVKPADASNQTFRVLWASRLSPEKIPQIVPEIGKALRHEGISIDMYGSSSLNEDNTYLENLPENVRYLGSFDGLNTLPLGNYDAFLYTSLFDGMPNTLLEIGSTGLPIVSSAVGGIPELIKDAQTGLLVTKVQAPDAYADALRRLRNSPELRKKLATALRKTVQKTYSQEQFNQSVVDMLKQLGL